MNRTADIAIRVAVIAVSLVLWFWTQKLISRKAPVGAGVVDRLHSLSAPLHGWLLSKPGAANALLIVTSILIDVFGLYLIGATILGPTVRPFLAMLMLFGLRQLCQGLCSLPNPDRVIWRYPGFPSLLVTYGVSNDFFFSGHTAIAVLGALELGHAAPAWVAFAAAVIAVLEAAAVIVLRAHFFIDVFTAAFVALACEMAAGRMAPFVDAWLRRLA
ncbi:MAG TPA: phosphatase PAP2-related protein [Opitutaceae bacterium]